MGGKKERSEKERRGERKMGMNGLRENENCLTRMH